jgi:hypothetical protein
MAKQATADIRYTTNAFTSVGTVAHQFAQTALSKYAKNNLDVAVIFPYNASDMDFEAVKEALPANTIIQEAANDQVTPHAHLKFFSDRLRKKINFVDLLDRNVKLVGPKHCKGEFDNLTAGSVHACHIRPAMMDRTRRQENLVTLKKRRARLERDIQLKERVLEASRETASRTDLVKIQDPRRYQEAIRVLGEIEDEVESLELEKLALERRLTAIEDNESVENGLACNVGVENCSVPADVIVMNDSGYDVKLRPLLEQANKIGAQEIYAVMILPYGLAFMREYTSEELRVKFIARGRGFAMVHLGDMSNGYVHDSDIAMEFIKHRIFRVNGSSWKAEIIDNIAEMVLMRITPASMAEVTVTRLMPTKFDDYVVVPDPFQFFRPAPRVVPILVNKTKLVNAVATVVRCKTNVRESKIRDIAAHAQTLYYSVQIGNTSLQKGAVTDNEQMDVITLLALIEGDFRFSRIEQAYRYAHPDLTASIKQRLSGMLGGVLRELFPAVWSFFTATRVEKYIGMKVDLRDSLVWDDNISCKPKTAAQILSDIYTSWKLAMASIADAVIGIDVYTVAEATVRDPSVETLFEYSPVPADDDSDDDSSATFYNAVDYDTAMQTHLANREGREARLREAEKLVGAKETDEIAAVTPNLPDAPSRPAREASTAGVHDLSAVVPARITLDSLEKVPNEDMCPLSKAAALYNTMRFKDGNLQPLSPAQIRQLMKTFTFKGRTHQVTYPLPKIENAIANLRFNYFVDSCVCPHDRLQALKEAVYDITKEVEEVELWRSVPERKVRVTNGFAGCGKTTLVMAEFDALTDTYLAPISGVVGSTFNDLKKHCRPHKPRVFTHEKLRFVPRKGRRLYIDEASVFTVGYLCLLLAYFDYEEYVLIGDYRQHSAMSPTGIQDTTDDFTDLVPADAITRCFYTFRFGPSAGLLLNMTADYPVFSLANHDTKVKVLDLDEFSEACKAEVTMTVTEATATDYAHADAVTGRSQQGMTVASANVLLAPADIIAANAFSSNPVVNFSRAKYDLTLYVDRTSKATKLTKNLAAFEANYSAIFNLVIPDTFDAEQGF